MIDFRDDVGASDVDGAKIVETARALLAAVGEANSAMSVSLVGDAAIRALNRDTRGKDKETDVLSFPMYEPGEEHVGEERFVGDVVISIDTARRQAAEYDAPLQRELERLLIHGVLHLLGHDHMEPEERAEMEAEERRLANVIGMPWPYDDA